MTTPSYSTPELLEARIAPAGVVIGFSDIDGDAVSIKLSADVGAGFVTGIVAGRLVTKLTIPDVAEADGLNIAITVKRGPGGDGLVAFGLIDATGVNLGNVSVAGDLAEIDAGDSTAGAVAIKSLKVRSMGVAGATSIDGGSDLRSELRGNVGALTVQKDIDGVFIDVEGADPFADGVISRLTIGGNLIGRNANDSGRIEAAGIGAVVVKGSILGGAGVRAGSIAGQTQGIGSLSLGGSLIGGTGAQSGQIFSDDGPSGAYKIGGDVIGGAGEASGSLSNKGETASFNLRGSILGGSGDFSGNVFITTGGAVNVGGNIVGGSADSGILTESGKLTVSLGVAPVKIGGSIIGGLASGTAELQDCGQLDIARVATTKGIFIGGSIIAGQNTNGVVVPGSGGVIVRDKVEVFTVKGSLLGNDAMQAFISVLGGFEPGLVLGKLTIGGDMVQARITGGFGPPVPPGFFDQKLADVQFGTIEVKGDFRASNIALGIEAGPDGHFGTADDDPLPSVSAGFISSIASITVKGAVAGNGKLADNFGFVAEQIGKLKLTGVNVALGAGFDAIVLPVAGGNLVVREAAVV